MADETVTETHGTSDIGRSNSELPSLTIGQDVSHYRIKQILGRGGMGEVYLAYDRALGRPAALKVLPKGFSLQLRTRLQREAWAISRLQHPAIATFYEAGEECEHAFIAMEYVAGRTLRERLCEGPLPIEQALAIAVCMLEALGHAATADLLHRDIKPENIMLTGDRSAKLLDFGLAKQMSSDVSAKAEDGLHPLNLIDTSLQETRELTALPGSAGSLDATSGHALTALGGVLGTIGYMAPEQLLGATVDHRTDLFQLGAVLFEMVTGCRAFPGATVQERVQHTLKTPPHRPNIQELGDELWAVLAKALSRNKEDRYQSSKELLVSLRLQGAASPLADTIAVLDFANLSEDHFDDWLGIGFAEGVVSRLALVSKLKLIPRPNVLQVQRGNQGSESELGLRLGCRWVVGGTVCRTTSELHASIRLIEAQTGHCAAEASASGELHELLEIQRHLADEVATYFDPAASPDERNQDDVQLFEWTTRGRRLMLEFQKDKQVEAQELFEKAVTRDPACSLALTGLAMVHALRYPFSTDDGDLNAALNYAQRAIVSDPQSGDAHVWLGYSLLQQNKDAAAIAEFLRATELAPDDFMAHYFAASMCFLRTKSDYERICQIRNLDLPGPSSHWRRAKLEASMKHYQKSLQINPLYVGSWIGLGHVHLYLQNRAESRWCMERAVQLEQQGATQARGGFIGFLGECLRQCGELAKARQCCLEGLKAVESTDFIYRDTHRGIFLCSLGRTALEMGDNDAARVAFLQAAQHLRGRFRARAAGNVLVQALAGLAHAGGESAPLDEALDLLRHQQGHDFHPFWFCTEDVSLLSLSRAAQALGRDKQAADLLVEAIESGSVEAQGYSVNQTQS